MSLIAVKSEAANGGDGTADADKEPPKSFGAGAKIRVLRFWVPSLAVPIAVGLGLRLLLLPWFSDPYNFYGSYLTTEILLSGLEPLGILSADVVFGELNPWGYPALYFSVTLFGYAVSLGDPYLYGVFLKVPSAILDVGTAILLFHIARLAGSSKSLARLVSVAWIFNPFSILTTSVWGVNDPLPVFFTVLALFFILRNHRRDPYLAGLSLGVGIALKLYPILLLPVLLARIQGARTKLWSLALILAVPLVTSLPLLLTNGATYLALLFGFAASAGDGVLDPQRTILQAIQGLVGPLDPRLAFIPAAVLVLVLWWIYRRTVRGNLHPILGVTAALLAFFLLAVRWIPNYALWVVPFTTLQAVLFTGGWRRWIPAAFWVPAMLDAGIYMGWFPNPFSGASGLPYWALIANGPAIILANLIPLASLIALGAAFVVATAATLYLALRKGPGQAVRVGTGPRAKSSRPRPRISGMALSLILLLAFVGGTLGSGYVQFLQRGAVTPTDFGSFVPRPEGSISVEDDFHARFLSFRWLFHGTGLYTLHPNGSSGILLDTVTPSGTAYLEDPIQSDSLKADLTFRIRDRYGLGPTLIATGPGGWLGITGTGGTPTLVYFDDREGQLLVLGGIGAGWNTATLSFDPDKREVRGAGSELVLGGAGLVEAFRLGHDRIMSDGGGVLEVAEVKLEWTATTPILDGPPPWTVVLAGGVTIGALYVVVGGVLTPPRKRNRS